MKKVFFNLFAVCLLAATSFLTACSEDEEGGVKVSVRFEATPAAEVALSKADLEGMKVVFTEVRNHKQTEGRLDINGIVVLDVYKGTYDVVIESPMKVDGKEMVATLRIENLSINTDNQTVKGSVNLMPKNALGQNFIFSEIFFNGERNSGQMMHPDQYIVIFNPTTGTLYADGLCVAVTQHLSRDDKAMWYDEFYPKRVPVGGFITIPGEGKEHPVAPGEKLVIAFTAVDHSAEKGYDHAVDLTGADFEIFQGAEAKDKDNPEVPNVLLTENGDKNVSGFFFQPRGYLSPLMFQLENGKKETIDAFIKANTTRTKHLIKANPDKGIPEAIVEMDIYSVDTDLILDGVQTSDEPKDVKTRTIPEVVDRGKFLVSGCHRQELAIRKEIKVNGKIFYQDTNNSTDDFIKQIGQNSWPKGWRDQK